MPNNEWSGPLMYTINGEFHSGNFDCEIKDIFPAAKGSQGYTEFEFSPDFIKYRMENPDSLSWNMGNIHSHNKMSTFFSGTDINDLQENSKCHNYYLSLIVNNAGDACAKISFIGKNEVTKNIIRTFSGDDGKVYSMKSTVVENNDVLYVYNCNVISENTFNVDESFVLQVDKIIDEYDKNLAKMPVNKFSHNIANNKYEGMEALPFYSDDMYQDEDIDEGADDYKIKPSVLMSILKSSLVCEMDYSGSLDEAVEIGYKDFIENGGDSITNVVMLMHNLIVMENSSLDDMDIAMSIYTISNLLEDYNNGDKVIFIEKLIGEMEESVEPVEE